MPACEVAQYLSKIKSNAYPNELADSDIVLTADTVVIAEDKILGKPADKTEATAMLSMLSARKHIVTTGVTIRSKRLSHSFSVTSTVSFRALNNEEIDYYIEKYKPYDKAGAYGIQEWIGYVAIEGIEGSFFNVMGLPVQRLYMELDAFIESDLLNSK